MLMMMRFLEYLLLRDAILHLSWLTHTIFLHTFSCQNELNSELRKREKMKTAESKRLIWSDETMKKATVVVVVVNRVYEWGDERQNRLLVSYSTLQELASSSAGTSHSAQSVPQAGLLNSTIYNTRRKKSQS